MDNNVIYDLLKEVREELSEQKEQYAEHGKCLVQIQSDLKYHIKRTDLLEDLHKDNLTQIKQNKERLERLEEPVKAKKYLFKRWQFWLGIGIGAATFVSKVIGLW